jgi:hypothetical protein
MGGKDGVYGDRHDEFTKPWTWEGGRRDDVEGRW